jgi:hypothetical protein
VPWTSRIRESVVLAVEGLLRRDGWARLVWVERFHGQRRRKALAVWGDEAVTVYMLHDAVDVVCKRELASLAAYEMVRVLDSGAMRGCVGIATFCSGAAKLWLFHRRMPYRAT